MTLTFKQLKTHGKLIGEWLDSNKTLVIEYLSGSGVWIECRSFIEWDVNTFYRAKE